eukprot:gene10742-11932_t
MAGKLFVLLVLQCETRYGIRMHDVILIDKATGRPGRMNPGNMRGTFRTADRRPRIYVTDADLIAFDNPSATGSGTLWSDTLRSGFPAGFRQGRHGATEFQSRNGRIVDSEAQAVVDTNQNFPFIMNAAVHNLTEVPEWQMMPIVRKTAGPTDIRDALHRTIDALRKARLTT